ncbi:MAG: SDR family oxidoreductase [Roseiflexaceae bacterium]|jgi:short-subunit dehydrogenase
MSLTNRVVVITGASSGFGADIARKAVAQGAKVVLAARSTDKLQALVAELGGSSHALAVTADVTSDSDIDTLVAAANAFGTVDTVINNAGFGLLDTLVDAPLVDLQRIMDVNVYGAVRCTRAFLPGMIARGHGQIIMMASMAGLVAVRNMAYYCASKFALVAIGRTLQQELSGTGVACTIICPGVAQTGFQTHAPNEKYPKAATLSNCTSDQVAGAVIRAMQRRTMGEVIVPGSGALLARFSAAFPGISRTIQNMIG